MNSRNKLIFLIGGVLLIPCLLIIIPFGLGITLGFLNGIKETLSETEVASSTPVATQPRPGISPSPTPTPTIKDLRSTIDEFEKVSFKEYETVDMNSLNEIISRLENVPASAREYKESKSLLNRAVAKRSKVRRYLAELNVKPKVWADGSLEEVRDYLRYNLNDYNSSEFIGWSALELVVLDNDEPFWKIRLRLRAKNAFGGYIVRDTTYYLQNKIIVRSEGLQ